MEIEYDTANMTNLVEAASWDITLGVAGTGLGHWILSATSSSEDVAPDSIDHTGIKVFGNLYEYGDLGILASPIPEDEGADLKSKYPAFSLRSVEELGYTDKSKEEFEAWLDEQNNGDFKGSNYNLVTTSCVVWAVKAAEFLGVPYPTNWGKLILWTQKNKGFTNIVGQSGLTARQLQHKATEYVQDPSKIKSKMKRLYKRLRRKRNADPESEEITVEQLNLEDGDGDDDDDDEDVDDEELAKFAEEFGLQNEA